MSSSQAEPEQSVEESVPAGWKAAKAANGRTYFYNSVSKASQWTCPQAGVLAVATPSTAQVLAERETVAESIKEPKVLTMLVTPETLRAAAATPFGRRLSARRAKSRELEAVQTVLADRLAAEEAAEALREGADRLVAERAAAERAAVERAAERAVAERAAARQVSVERAEAERAAEKAAEAESAASTEETAARSAARAAVQVRCHHCQSLCSHLRPCRTLS